MDRLILDTSLLIAGGRGDIDPGDFGDPGGGHDVSVPAIAVAEFLMGALRNPDAARGHTSRAFLDMVLDVLAVEDYTYEVAKHHASLMAHVLAVGRPRGAHDLVIAATARATKRTILTTDRRARFDDLPGVEARLVAV